AQARGCGDSLSKKGARSCLEVEKGAKARLRTAARAFPEGLCRRRRANAIGEPPNLTRPWQGLRLPCGHTYCGSSGPLRGIGSTDVHVFLGVDPSFIWTYDDKKNTRGPVGRLPDA